MAELTCRGVYTSALALIAEPSPSGEDSRRSDYDERAPYLLAAMCDEARAVDRAFRQAEGDTAQTEFSPVCIELDAAFPLTERFAAPAAYYLASMLVLEENEALSDKLYGHYCDMMSSLCSRLPAAAGGIVDVYGFN